MSKKPSQYRVSWEIDVSADSPAEAVKIAVVGFMKPDEPDLWAYGVREDGPDKHKIYLEGKDIDWPDNIEES